MFISANKQNAQNDFVIRFCESMYWNRVVLYSNQQIRYKREIKLKHDIEIEIRTLHSLSSSIFSRKKSELIFSPTLTRTKVFRARDMLKPKSAFKISPFPIHHHPKTNPNTIKSATNIPNSTHPLKQPQPNHYTSFTETKLRKIQTIKKEKLQLQAA